MYSVQAVSDGIYRRMRETLKTSYYFFRPNAWLDKYARPAPGYEPEFYLLPALVDPERAAVDVGANLGKYTLALASLVPSVHAIEPSPLCKYLKRYFPKNVKAYAVAASDTAGTAQLSIPMLGGGQEVEAASIEPEAVAAFSRSLRPVSVESITVPTVRLDDLIKDEIGFMKIDVEGHELSALRGATRILTEHKPVLLVEAEERHAANAVDRLNKFLKDFDYDGFFCVRKKIQHIAEFSMQLQGVSELSKRVSRDEMHYVNNFIFVQTRTKNQFHCLVVKKLSCIQSLK